MENKINYDKLSDAQIASERKKINPNALTIEDLKWPNSGAVQLNTTNFLAVTFLPQNFPIRLKVLNEDFNLSLGVIAKYPVCHSVLAKFLPERLLSVHYQTRNVKVSKSGRIAVLLSKPTDIRILNTDTAVQFMQYLESNYFNQTRISLKFDPKKPFGWLSLFAIYPSYDKIITSYLVNPDEGASSAIPSDDNTIKDMVEESIIRMNDVGQNNRIHLQDIRAACHMIIVCLQKTLNNERKESQFALIRNKRESALRNPLRSTEFVPVIDNDFLINLSDEMNFFPELKLAVWSFCSIETQDFPELQTAKQLTMYAGMANIHSVMLFFQGHVRVLAHRCKSLLPEISKFSKKKREIEKKIGVENFPYMRFIIPQDQTIIAKEFPTLFRVAKTYCTAFISDTYRNIATPEGKIDPDFLAYAIQIDDEHSKYSTMRVGKFMSDDDAKEFFRNEYGYDYKTGMQIDIEADRITESTRRKMQDLLLTSQSTSQFVSSTSASTMNDIREMIRDEIRAGRAR